MRNPFKKKSSIEDLTNLLIAKKNHRINAYSCITGHVLLSIDKDDGVTPMFVDCHCGNQARSNFYTPHAPDVVKAMLEAQSHQELYSTENMIPHLIWFRPETPEQEELAFNSWRQSQKEPISRDMRRRIEQSNRDHVKRGGLICIYTDRYMAELKK